MAQPLKDMVARPVVADIAARIKRVVPEFAAAAFVSDLMAELPDLELKPRIAAIARRLAAGLDDDYRTALAVVTAVARQDPPIEGFAAWPLCTFVEIFGVEDPDASLPAMEHLTKRASCEFAIRPFLHDHWDAAIAQLTAFAEHDDPAVRRLASEGTRPRLPWGKQVARLRADPAAGLELLERLRHDPDESVRRSVANHLNDVSKDHPELVIATVRRWAGGDPPADGRMLGHALRTLVKQGHPEALGALGYTTEPQLLVRQFMVSPQQVTVGDSIELTAELESTTDTMQRLVVDFVIHHINRKGATSPKVFKWANLELPGGETVRLTKKRPIAMASTRTYYAGEHRVDLQVAGEVIAETAFAVML